MVRCGIIWFNLIKSIIVNWSQPSSAPSLKGMLAPKTEFARGIFGL